MTNLPEHLSVFEGDLYDNRVKAFTPLRANFSRGHGYIESVADLKATLRHGKYTDLGCYPLYFIMSDGEAMSFDAVRAEFRQIARAIQDHDNSGWRVVACDINREDNDLYCCHTGAKIESACGDDSSEDSDPETLA